MKVNPPFWILAVSFYVLVRQTENGYIPSVVFCSTRGVDVGGWVGGDRDREDITWLALTQFNIQDMSALWKMQLHVSQRDTASVHAEKTSI